MDKRGDPGSVFGIVLGTAQHHNDPTHPIGLLRLRSERQHHRRATENRHEIAAIQLIKLQSIPLWFEDHAQSNLMLPHFNRRVRHLACTYRAACADAGRGTRPDIRG